MSDNYTIPFDRFRKTTPDNSIAEQYKGTRYLRDPYNNVLEEIDFGKVAKDGHAFGIYLFILLGYYILFQTLTEDKLNYYLWVIERLSGYEKVGLFISSKLSKRLTSRLIDKNLYLSSNIFIHIKSLTKQPVDLLDSKFYSAIGDISGLREDEILARWSKVELKDSRHLFDLFFYPNDKYNHMSEILLKKINNFIVTG